MERIVSSFSILDDSLQDLGWAIIFSLERMPFSCLYCYFSLKYSSNVQIFFLTNQYILNIYHKNHYSKSILDLACIFA
jgi:hypothetical protein